MRRLHLAVLVALVSAIVSLAGQSGPSARSGQGNDLFQKALSKERVDGQLTEAIALYEQIVRESASDRALAARALVQLGRCYERLGRSDAHQAYQRVVQEFADQKVSAAEARTRLTALAPTLPPGARMAVRQLWAGDNVDIGGSVSADGRYLSFTDWGTGNLSVRDLAAGTNRRLATKAAIELAEYADASTMSPDGTQVAYAWSDRTGRYQLRVIALDGSPPRVLVDNPEIGYFVPHAWSPDRRHVVTVFYRRDRTTQVALVPVAGGAPRILKTFDWREPKRLRFSPGGRWIAYDFPPREESPDRDLYLLAADGSREVRLIEHASDDLHLGWTPDGTRIIFASNRGSGMGIWMARVADARIDGSPELVKADAGQIVPLGVTQNGAFYYAFSAGANDVYLADIDPAHGQLRSAPVLATSRYQGFNSTPAFSPDGEQLAFISQRLPNATLSGGARAPVVRSLRTGEERVLSLPVGVGFELKWSPDSRSLLVSGRDLRGRFGLYKIDAQSGEAALLLPGVSTCNVGCSSKGWFPDGTSVYFVRTVAEDTKDRTDSLTRHIVRRDLPSGAEQEVIRYQRDEYSFVTLSPDGTQFAAWLRAAPGKAVSLAIVPSGGGQPREIVRLAEQSPLDLGAIAWAPDGRHLYYSWRAGTSKPAELWRAPLAGGAPESLGSLVGRVHDLAIHPDGTRMTFSTRAPKPEVWVMENFLPSAAKSTASAARGGRR